MKIEPIFLKGNLVALEPLNDGHVGPLCEFGLNEELWRFTFNQITTAEHMRSYVETALTEETEGTSLPFITKPVKSDKIVGCTRFGNIDTANRKMEVGWTWIDPEWQRSFVNTEAKLLKLTHAFEVWNCVRVEFKTDVLNVKSRNAIVRIGAVEEGILRNHMITDSGHFRNSIFFQYP